MAKKKSIMTKKPNKEVKKTAAKGTVKITNISPQAIIRGDINILPGKSGMVTQYEADLLRRKKLAK